MLRMLISDSARFYILVLFVVHWFSVILFSVRSGHLYNKMKIFFCEKLLCVFLSILKQPELSGCLEVCFAVHHQAKFRNW